MTFIGKTFVLVNLFLSVLMTTIAFGLYANGLDWTDKKAPKAGKPDGLLKQKQDEVNRVAGASALVEGSWSSAVNDLLGREVRRRANRVWYTTELEHPVTKATDADPVRGVRRENFLAVPDKKNNDLPGMVPLFDGAGQKLLSLAHYEKTLKTRLDDIEEALTEYKTQIAKDKDLTDELAGTKDGTKRGLRQTLADEQQKLRELEEVERQIRPLFVNIGVDSALAERRLKAMEERIRELQE